MTQAREDVRGCGYNQYKLLVMSFPGSRRECAEPVV